MRAALVAGLLLVSAGGRTRTPVRSAAALGPAIQEPAPTVRQYRTRRGVVREKRFVRGDRVTTVRQDPDGSITQKTRAGPTAAEEILIVGRRTTSVVLKRQTGLTVRFATGAQLVGRGSGNGIELKNDCRKITIQGPGTVTGWYIGVRIADSGAAEWDNIRLLNLSVLNSSRQGLLTINSAGIAVDGGKYETGSDHGLYWSSYGGGKASTHIRARNVEVLRKKGSNFAAQVNSEGGRGKAGPVEWIDCKIGKKSSEKAVNLLGADPVTITGGTILGKIHCDKAPGTSWATHAKLVGTRWQGGKYVPAPSTLVSVN